MATTTNYSWTTPDDTALVKDGASAIRALGTAIDTSMNTALGTKKAGMVLLNTTSFSAVSSVSLPASTFTTTYNRYKIDFRALTSIAGTDIDGRLRASGTDASATDYYHQLARASGAAFYAERTNLNRWYIAGSVGDTTGETASMFEIINPAQSVKTTAVAVHTGQPGTTGSILSYTMAYLHNLTTSYDSMSFIPSSGTITGTVSVYGYNK